VSSSPNAALVSRLIYDARKSLQVPEKIPTFSIECVKDLAHTSFAAATVVGCFANGMGFSLNPSES